MASTHMIVELCLVILSRENPSRKRTIFRVRFHHIHTIRVSTSCRLAVSLHIPPPYISPVANCLKKVDLSSSFLCDVGSLCNPVRSSKEGLLSSQSWIFRTFSGFRLTVIYIGRPTLIRFPLWPYQGEIDPSKQMTPEGKKKIFATDQPLHSPWFDFCRALAVTRPPTTILGSGGMSWGFCERENGQQRYLKGDEKKWKKFVVKVVLESCCAPSQRI